MPVNKNKLHYNIKYQNCYIIKNKNNDKNKLKIRKI